MTFINPLFLLGLLGISVPVIIHFLSKKKPRRQDFGDIRFLELASSRAMRKFRLRQYLLLLARCLAIAAVTLMFARPVMRYTSGGRNVDTVFLLDVSYSMGYSEDGRTRLEVASECVKKILGQLGVQEKSALFVFSDVLEPVVKNPTTDRALLLSQLSSVKLTYRKTDVAAAVSRLLESFKNVPGKKRMIIVTDFAANGWRRPAADVSSDWEVVCVDAGAGKQANFVASAAEQSQDDLTAGTANFSDSKKRISASVYCDGVKYKSLFFDTLPGRQAFTIFSPSGLAGGPHKCVFETEPDKLQQDNSLYFMFDSADKLKILLVDGNPQFSDFKSEVYFLKNAVQNNASARVINPAQLDDEPLDGYQAVFLCNVADFSRAAVVKLSSFVSANKCLVFFLGDNVTPEKYDSQIRFLLPCSISSKVAGGSVDAYSLPDDPGLASGITVDRHFLLAQRPGSDIVLKFSDGTPLLVRGRNPVFVFAVSANLGYSNLPVRPVFPVILRQVLAYAVRDRVAVSTATVGASLADIAGPAAVENVFLEGRASEVASSGNFELPGNYEIRYSNGKIRYVSVNVDALSGESDLTKAESSAAKEYFRESLAGTVQAGPSFEKNIRRILFGEEVTWAFAWLFVFFIAAETLLTSRWMKS
jgi:hypothetical protein